MSDATRPDHYTARNIICPSCGHNIEAHVICEPLGFWIGNSFKYLYRAPYKEDYIEDLLKAKECIQMEIDRYKLTLIANGEEE